MNRLWYRRPAAEWEEALPLGNGRIGAMVYGGTDWEHIQVNEESMWYGKGGSRVNPDARENLERVRECLSQGRLGEAERLMGLSMTGCPNSMHSYQTLGDIYFSFGKGRVVSESDFKRPRQEPCEGMSYARELSLEESICRTRFQDGHTQYFREYFLSKPADCLVMHFSAKECGAGEIQEGMSGEQRGQSGGKGCTGKINFTAKLARGKYFDGVKRWGHDRILLYGNLGRGGIEYASALGAKVRGGSLRAIGECLCVEDAKEAWLYFTADTTWHCGSKEQEAFVEQYIRGQQECGAGVPAEKPLTFRERELLYQEALQALLQERIGACLQKAMGASYEALRQEHVEDYQSLYNRVKLTLKGKNTGKEAADTNVLTTDERLARVQEGAVDVGLEKQLFDYARYLMISCSREGGLPATLQGLWNKEFQPPWDSKYTININTEMNYWMAEGCGLPECHLPLFELLKKVRENGRATARQMYGCRGFVAHHNTDIHGDTAPQDIWYPGTYWVMGAAWLCTHLWTHYLYTLDRDFLKEAFPMLAESALFFVDFLVERGDYLVTSPSVSPENTYILPNGERGCICEGAAMDTQILRDLISDCLDAWAVLGKEAGDCSVPGVDSIEELMEELRRIREKLPPITIGSDGRILEWMEEYGEADPGHRHISHLFGLFPSNQITVDQTPELAAAARKTLEHRLLNGGGHTGWSRAWIMNHYAKLWDGEKFHENIRQMLAKSTYPNLFDRHPPFQIDGNFGACCAIMQALVQSDGERIILLPALPESWESGEARGLRVAGGAQVELAWKANRLERVLIAVRKADCLYRTVVKYRDRQRSIVLPAGGYAILREEDFI